MIYVSWAVFCIYILFVALFKIAKQFAKFITAVFIITVIGVPFMNLLPHVTEWSRITELSNNVEIQFAYKYKDNVYYSSNKREGIYKLNKTGEITKVADALKINSPTEYTLCGDGNFIHFLSSKTPLGNKSQWKNMNLDTGEIKAEPEFMDVYQSCGYMQDDYIEKEKVLKKIGYVSEPQIRDDGYIYFSTISTLPGVKQGVYRTRTGSDEYELVVDKDNLYSSPES